MFFFVLQNRCSCKCCRFSLEGARSNCMCPELRACMCTPRSMKSSKLRTLMCGAFDAVSFSVGDIGSHWSNGLCCCDLVRDNYAADSSGVFFVSSCRRVCFCSAYHGWTGSWSVPRLSSATVSAFFLCGCATTALVASGPCSSLFDGPSLELQSPGHQGLSDSILWSMRVLWFVVRHVGHMSEIGVGFGLD